MLLVRIWVRIGTLECALVSRREFDLRHDLAINFDTSVSASIVFGPFLRGSNSTNPVNMLRPSTVNPAVSSFEQLHGSHNYDSHPFSILGSTVEVHVTPKSRQT